MEKEIGEFVNPDENLPRFGICRRIEYRSTYNRISKDV